MTKPNNYEELAEQLDIQELDIIRHLQNNKHLLKLQEKIETQVPKTPELVSQYTKNQFIEQSVEIMPGLNCTFRTPSPYAVDESMIYANKNTKTETNVEFSRIMARRRLSHSLIAINDNKLSTVQITGDMIQSMAGNKEFREGLLNRANEVYEKLEMNGLADKISEAFGVWERVIFNRMNNIEDIGETLKNSTRDSKSA